MSASSPASRRAGVSDAIVAAAILVICLLSWNDLEGVNPQATQFPKAVIFVLGLLAVVIGLRALLSVRRRQAVPGVSDAEGDGWRFFVDWRHFVIALFCFAAYALVFPYTGFFSASVVFMAVVTLALGFRGYRTMAITYLLFLIFVYVVFVAVFERPIPLDPWLRGLT